LIRIQVRQRRFQQAHLEGVLESLDWPRESLREASGRDSSLRFGDECLRNCGVKVVFALLPNSLLVLQPHLA
jgi:hypothetical protein